MTGQPPDDLIARWAARLRERSDAIRSAAGEPITPWAEYQRARWAAFADPLRPFGTDEEPSDYAEPWSYRVFDAAARWWHPALTAALGAIGIRRFA